MSDWQKVWSLLAGKEGVVILIHEKPDGDCLGSALALGLCLEKKGIKPVILHNEEPPQLYRFLPGMHLYKVQESLSLAKDSTVIAVDCADQERPGYVIPKENILINIDHHISNNYFGTLNIVDTTAAAAGEIIYRLFQEGGLEISPSMATCLYVAISTDTGSFTYSNTTAKTLRIASELIALGTDLDLIRSNLYEKRPLKELLTVKAALERLFLCGEGRIIGCVLDYETLTNNNLLGVDTDGLIGMMRGTEGVEVALLFKEVKKGEIRVSMRSKLQFDVNVLAQNYGGGGHARAAGCTVKGEMESVRRSVLQNAIEQLKRGGTQ